MHEHHRFREPLVLTFGVVLITVVGHMGRLPGTPNTPPPAAATSNNDDGCHATVIATDGTQPPDVPTLDPGKACDALQQAERDAACLGDWQPPTEISQRAMCAQIHQRGCGNPYQDCDQLPDDPQHYYYHH